MKNPLPKITISTESHYLADQSSSEEGRHVWSYDITIRNDSEHIVQLLNRSWVIRDGNNKLEEVKGPGVIGLQPLIKPGKIFSYSSFCQLPTATGSMQGQYEFQTLEEMLFEVEIPRLVLLPNTAIHPLRSSLH